MLLRSPIITLHAFSPLLQIHFLSSTTRRRSLLLLISPFYRLLLALLSTGSFSCFYFNSVTYIFPHYFTMLLFFIPDTLLSFSFFFNAFNNVVFFFSSSLNAQILFYLFVHHFILGFECFFVLLIFLKISVFLLFQE